MKSVYALIPAALLAGTVLSAPVEAKRADDPAVHAERFSAKHKDLKNKLVKKAGKLPRVGEIKSRKTKSVARLRKGKSEPIKTASVRPRKVKLTDLKTSKSIAVAAASQLD